MIPVIDLFAGPGGLGEGFSSFMVKQKPVYKIKASVEKDELAHKTLLLRSFFRQFPKGKAPVEYYAYLSKNNKTESDVKSLFSSFPKQFKKAQKEAIRATLGCPDDESGINSAIGERIKIGGNWVLIGGPPCQAYSIVGRSRLSKLRREDIASFESDKRHTLYLEYLKIIAKFQPAVFVMENVKGILSSTLEGKKIFGRILNDLENPLTVFNGDDSNKNLSYKLYPLVRTNGNLFDFEPDDFIVKAEDYGVPQARHRVFLLGIRSDIDVIPGQLSVRKKRTVGEVIADLPEIRSKLSKGVDSIDTWKNVLCSVLSAPWFGRNSELVGNELWEEIKYITELIKQSRLTTGDEFVCSCNLEQLKDDWYYDPKLSGVCNHSSRGHINTDLHRYFFASAFAKVYKRSPTLRDFPKELLPNHKNVNMALMGGMFSDRFKVQLTERAATTVTSHISKDGHYFIHPKPEQCRSLTVREAARLQTFPDNYLFEGPRTSQYQQVGNAVPPYLASQIAGIVYDVLKKANKTIKRGD
jgi:DNA (cytosine-5)-methyltransferase 1